MQHSWTRDDCERSGLSIETPPVSSPEEDDSSKEATVPYETPPLALALNAAYRRQSVRQRTAQACDKCRERKTKVRRFLLRRDATLISKFQCSGHRPCNRCTNRGLNCEYSVRELRTTTRLPPPLPKDLTEFPAPQPAKYSGVCRSALERVGGALRTPSSSYGTPPPPYTPRRGINTYDQVRWLPSQQSQALSAQKVASHMVTRDGLPAPSTRVRRRSAGASVSDPSCRPVYSIPYQLLPHQPNPVIRAHEEDLAYTRDGVASMPMPTPDSSNLPFDVEMLR